METLPPNSTNVVQALQLPRTLDAIVSAEMPFEFYQWGHPNVPTGEKIDIYRLDVIHHYVDPEINRVLDLTVQITNKETGAAVDLNLTRLKNGRYAGFFEGSLKDIGDLPTFLDEVADLPRSTMPVRNVGDIHQRLAARIVERAKGIRTSFAEDDPETGFKM